LADALYILAAALLCYLIGSLPTGYLFVKYFHKKDITQEGSGNVGTLNAYQVSHSHITTVSVLIFDVLKGVLPVYLINYISNYDILTVYTGSVFIIIGHNYPVWLKFKGGRGLASAAGIFAVINFALIVTWCIVWVAARLLKKGTLFSNFIATAVLPFSVILLRSFYNDTFTIMFSVYEYNYNYFIIFVFIVTILILIKHGEVFLKLRMKNEK
jgi:glycerol-3-phosphate acyltransferase PlsY